jgi:uncharacterized protein (TIGR02598 family)
MRTTSTKSKAGFTLVETALAIGLLAALILPILGLLTAGATEASKAQVHRQTSRVREDIRLRLQDPAWLAELAAGRTWETTLEYDRKGRLIEDNAHLPSMTVRLQGMQAPGFRSDRFEAVKIRVHNAKTNRLLDEAVVQRRKETTT